MTTVGYMLDTNVFNAAVRKKTSRGVFAGLPVYATHVQPDELTRTKNETVRVRLLEEYGAIGPKVLPTETAIWDDTPWDGSHWSAEDGVYEKLLRRLQELDKIEGKSSNQSLNQSRDARIAETALRHNLTLVTDDSNLACVMREHGGTAVTFDDFTALVDR